MPDRTNVIRGWAAWRGDELHSQEIARTKRDLLIGFDLLPLRGLSQTERFLASRGIVMARTVVAPCGMDERRGFALAARGRLVRESLSWPIAHRGDGVWKVGDTRGHELLTFHSACGFLACRWSDVAVSGEDRAGLFRDGPLTVEEVQALNRLWFRHDLDYSDPSEPRDRRTRPSLARLRETARAAMARLGIEIVPVDIRRVGKMEMPHA